MLVPYLVDPGKVIDARRLYFKMFYRLLRHRQECRFVGSIRVNVETVRHLYIPAIRQYRRRHRIAPEQLMAQADDLDFAVSMYGCSHTNERVDQVEIPGSGTKRFHVSRDCHNQRQVARRVRERAGSAIFGIGLAHTVPQGDAPVQLPNVLALPHLDRDQHKIGLGQQVAALGRAGDANFGVPGAVHLLGQLMNDA